MTAGGPQPGQLAMVDLSLLPPEVLDLLMQLGALQPMGDMGMDPMMDPTAGQMPDPSAEAIKRMLAAGPPAL